MLIETNTSPTNTIYFIGSQLIEMFLQWLFQSNMELEEMYNLYTKKHKDIWIVKFIYVLDWLFIIGIIDFSHSYITFLNDN